MIVLTVVVGYLIGALPTAGAIASLHNIDLRGEGSGNPGTTNALRLGGPTLAIAVLVVELTKGASAVLIGQAMAGVPGAILAGIAAVAGNVFNIFYAFSGGKGLGISGGVLLAAWPTVMIPAVFILVIAVLVTRSSGASAIIAIVSLAILAVVWVGFELPVAWGLDATKQVLILAIGLSLVLWQKHWREARLSRPRPA